MTFNKLFLVLKNFGPIFSSEKVLSYARMIYGADAVLQEWSVEKKKWLRISNHLFIPSLTFWGLLVSKVSTSYRCRLDNGFFVSLPTWRTLSTHPVSSSFNPLQKERFWGSAPALTGGTRDNELYMQMSLSFLGKDQKMILRCTGSGMRSYRSSILWKGMFSATILAVMSSSESGERGPGSLNKGPPPAAWEQHNRLATAIDDTLSLTEQ